MGDLAAPGIDHGLGRRAAGHRADMSGRSVRSGAGRPSYPAHSRQPKRRDTGSQGPSQTTVRCCPSCLTLRVCAGRRRVGGRIGTYARVMPRPAAESVAGEQSPVAQLAEHSAVNRRVAGSSPAGGAPRGHLTCIYRCRSDGRFRTRSSKVTINSPLIRSTGITNHGAIHRRSSLWMSPPTSHVLALCHRRVCVLQNVSGHPC